MKCRICKGKAEIYLPQYNLALCREHYIEFFLKRVKKAIKDFKMFSRQDRILVAVSGGKDSLSLWDALNSLGYNTAGFFLDLGIDGHSAKSREKVENFAKERGLSLKIEELKDAFGMTLPEITKKLREPACKLCGRLKRYYMEQAAKGYDVIATGHNMDDEVAFLMGNIFNWKEEYLAHQSPVLPAEHGFSKKVKPLIYLSERETAAYAFMRGIDYHDERCPLSKGATSIFYKNIMRQMELGMRGVRFRFLKGFYSIQHRFKSEERETPSPCRLCGYPTTAGGLCSVCRMKIRLGLLPEALLEESSGKGQF